MNEAVRYERIDEPVSLYRMKTFLLIRTDKKHQYGWLNPYAVEGVSFSDAAVNFAQYFDKHCHGWELRDQPEGKYIDVDIKDPISKQIVSFTIEYDRQGIFHAKRKAD